MIGAMDGVSTIRALRAEAETRHIPVIVVSVLSARERRETGADAAVVKPVDQEALLATVRGVLEGHDTQVRPCLVYSPEGSRALGSRFVMPVASTSLPARKSGGTRSI